MSDKSKPVYAPLPARAMVDMRLSERHLRTLAVVAAHDRLGKNGIGCWASHQRLAEMVGCHYTRISHNLKELGELGYIERVEHPLNKRLRVYKVIYTDADARVMKATAKAIANDYSCPDGQVSDDSIVAQPDNPDADIVAYQNQQVAVSIEEPPVNIFPEGGNRSRETLGRNSAEAARSYEHAVGFEDERLSLDARLAILERSLPDIKELPNSVAVPLLGRLWTTLHEMAEKHDAHSGDPAGGRALRLADVVGEMWDLARM